MTERLDNVEMMIDEHDHNRMMFDGWEKRIRAAYEGKEELDPELFRGAVDFVRKYTDGLHHHKEELYLFDTMRKNLGEKGKSMIDGMLIEHRIGRQMVKQIDEAITAYEDFATPATKLDVLANSLAYIFYLRKHMIKEDLGVFMYGKENLPKELWDEVEELSQKWDDDPANVEARKYYEDFIAKIAY